MEDKMKYILVSVPEGKYDIIKSDLFNTFSNEMKEWGLKAIRDGIPLCKSVKDLVDIEDRLNKLSERVGNIENLIKEEKETQLKKLQAEIDYAKLRYNYDEILAHNMTNITPL